MRRRSIRRQQVFLLAWSVVLWTTLSNGTHAQSSANQSVIDKIRSDSLSLDVSVRESAATSLAEVAGNPVGEEMLQQFLGDSSREVRLAALRSAREFRVSNQTRDKLLGALRTASDSDERVETISTLEPVCDETCFEVIGSAAADANEATAIRSIRALLEIGQRTKQFPKGLIRALTSDTAAVRKEAVDAFRDLAFVAWPEINELVRSTADRDEDVQAAALEALGAMAPYVRQIPAAVLSAASADRPTVVRHRALGVIGKFEDERGIAILKSAMGDESSTVRANAITSLAHAAHAGEETPALLAAALADRDPTVVVSALEAMGTLKYTNEEARKAVLALVSSPNVDVRRAAVNYFNSLESGISDYAAALVPVLDDPVPDIQLLTMAALRTIPGSDEYGRLGPVPEDTRSELATRLIQIASNRAARPDVRDAALRAASVFVTPDDANACNVAVHMSSEPYFADTAAETIGLLGSSLSSDFVDACGRGFIGALGGLSRSPDPAVRAAAAKAIGRIHKDDDNDVWASESYGLLALFAQDSSTAVREAVADGVGSRLDDTVGLKVLAMLLSDNDRNIRTSAFKAAKNLQFDSFAVNVLVGTQKRRSIFSSSEADGVRAVELAGARLAVLRQLAQRILQSDATPEELGAVASALESASTFLESLTSGPLPPSIVLLGIKAEDDTRATINAIVDQFIQLAGRDNPRLVASAINGLSPHVADVRVRTLIKERTIDKEPRVRAAAVSALAPLLRDDPEARALARKALRDSEVIVVQASIGTSGGAIDEEDLPVFRRAALGHDLSLRDAAIAAFARGSRSDELMTVLRTAVLASSREMAARSLMVSSNVDAALLQQAVELGLRDRERSVRVATLQAMSRLDDLPVPLIKAIDTLCIGSKDASREDAKTREVAAESISRIAKARPEAALGLSCFLDDPASTVRRAAVAGVEQMGREAATPLGGKLVKLLGDSDPDVRLASLDAVRAVRPQLAIPENTLLSSLKDTDVETRQRALRAIAALGTASDGMVRIIAEATSDPDLREDAISALESIGGKALPYLKSAARTRFNDEENQAVAAAIGRVERRLSPKVLKVRLRTGETRSIRIDDGTVVFVMATWCPFSKELLEFLHRRENAVYFRGIRFVYVFFDEWDDIRSKVRAELKEKKVWTAAYEEQLVAEFKRKANGAAVFDPAVVEGLGSSAVIASTVEGVSVDSYPKVFIHDTGLFGERWTWRASKWFDRRLGMPSNASAELGGDDLAALMSLFSREQ